MFERIRALVLAEDVRITSHAVDELTNDRIDVAELLDSFSTARLVESDPHDPRGPSSLTLHETDAGRRLHAVWGIPRGESRPAVLITAYEPNPDRWDQDLMRRRQPS